MYGIGESSDCSVDVQLSDNVHDQVTLFRGRPTEKASFATKHVNRELLGWDPAGRTRVRFSLMPERVAKLLDVRTDRIADRIAAIDDFVAAGYEVHVNLSPVVTYEGWLAEWAELLSTLDDGIGPAAKAQLAAEVMFLTHNEALHDLNLGWHPKAEELLWKPEVQEPKRSGTGGDDVRHRAAYKRVWVQRLTALISERLPYCRTRYAF